MREAGTRGKGSSCCARDQHRLAQPLHAGSRQGRAMETSAAPARALPPASTAPPPPLLASPPLPPRPGEKADALTLLADPLIELCPSLHSIQTLCLLPVASLPERDESFRRRRLEKALLRAASNGDVELISWVCNAKRQRKGPEAKALEWLEWGSLRDDEGTGPLNLAASSGHADIVQMLVQNGADVEERDACELLRPPNVDDYG